MGSLMVMAFKNHQVQLVQLILQSRILRPRVINLPQVTELVIVEVSTGIQVLFLGHIQALPSVPSYVHHANFKNYLFIIIILAALDLHCCARAFSSCGEQGLLFAVVCGLLIAVASLVAEHRLQARGLQQLWLMGSRAQAQQLWRMGLVALRHVASSWTKARTHVPCIGRQILNHYATSEVPMLIFNMKYTHD